MIQKFGLRCTHPETGSVQIQTFDTRFDRALAVIRLKDAAWIVELVDVAA